MGFGAFDREKRRRLQHCIMPLIYERKFPGHKSKIFLNRKNINPAENDTSLVPRSVGDVCALLLVKKTVGLS